MPVRYTRPESAVYLSSSVIVRPSTEPSSCTLHTPIRERLEGCPFLGPFLSRLFTGFSSTAGHTADIARQSLGRRGADHAVEQVGQRAAHLLGRPGAGLVEPFRHPV